MDELVDKDIELAIDSFNVFDAGLDTFFVCDIHLDPVGTSGADIIGREHLLTGQRILGHQ